jgi:putative regulatory protein, FmdB family
MWLITRYQEVLTVMPTYVYACDACGAQFEQFQSFKDEPLRVCRCGQEGSVRRVFQPVGIVFKGSGWYITDSRKSDSASIGSDSSSKSEKSETSGSES